MDSNNIDNDETWSSILDNENQENRSPEEVFAEIIKSSTEYTTEKIEVLLAKKKKLLSVLKTHRPIKITDYVYGLSENLRKDRRIIVFEWKDRRMIREYTQLNQYRNRWVCPNCEKLYKRRLITSTCYLYLIGGVAFISIVHKCQPRDYEVIMQYQKYLAEGNVALARRMTQTIPFNYGESSLANILNKLNNPPPLPKNSSSAEKQSCNDNKFVAKASASSKRKSNDTDQISSANKKSKTKKGISEETTINKNKYVLLDNNQSIPKKVQSGKNKLISEGPSTSVIQDEFNYLTNNSLVGKLDKKKSLNGNSDLSNNQEHRNSIPSKLLFERPSTWMLKEICNKLGIKYCKNAFWNEIIFKEIKFSLSDIKTQKYKTKNFYKILSNFFTGKFCDYGQIYYAINCAFRDKLVDDGKLEPEEIDELCSSYTVTNKHFKFISKFLSCRILIFDDDADLIRKYGEWKNTNNALTLVLSYSDSKYSVVVNL